MIADQHYTNGLLTSSQQHNRFIVVYIFQLMCVHILLVLFKFPITFTIVYSSSVHFYCNVRHPSLSFMLSHTHVFLLAFMYWDNDVSVTTQFGSLSVMPIAFRLTHPSQP